MMVERFKRDLIKEFRNYDRMMLMQDLMAGLTVTAVAIPLALAFGVGSGATAASGLVTAIIAGVIISALGGAYFQISGPTGRHGGDINVHYRAVRFAGACLWLRCLRALSSL